MLNVTLLLRIHNAVKSANNQFSRGKAKWKLPNLNIIALQYETAFNLSHNSTQNDDCVFQTFYKQFFALSEMGQCTVVLPNSPPARLDFNRPTSRVTLVVACQPRKKVLWQPWRQRRLWGLSRLLKFRQIFLNDSVQVFLFVRSFFHSLFTFWSDNLRPIKINPKGRWLQGLRMSSFCCW